MCGKNYNEVSFIITINIEKVKPRVDVKGNKKKEVKIMGEGKFKYFIGIDIGSEDFTVSIITTPTDMISTKEKITNNHEGFESYVKWLSEQGINSQESLTCVENTGVYGELLCYFLHEQGYKVAIEAPHKVKRAFNDLTKSDRVDSRKIAEYAYRFIDQLSVWKPNDEVFEQIKVLYSTREHLTEQVIANENALKALQRKAIQTPVANKTYEKLNKELKNRIKTIDKEIDSFINKNPTIKRMTDLADSVPGVGKQLSGHLMVMTEGFTTNLSYKELSSFIGIAPHEHTSGKSVHRKSRSTQHGNPAVRKLLHLAARSVSTHIEEFRQYYLRKLAEGKPKRLIYNNISNKLIKIVLAVVRSGSGYVKTYKSINPMYLKMA